MAELQIKTESQAQRCEICHQADYFSPQTNHCLRCANIILPSKSITKEVAIRRHSPYYHLGLLIGMIFGLLSEIPPTILGAIIGGVTGFILGFFFALTLGVIFGIGGMLLGATIGTNRNSTKKCPFCAEKIKKEALKCRYCGSMLNNR